MPTILPDPNGSDDTKVIQDALDALAPTGGKLIFPKAGYKTLKPLVFGNNITIEGEHSECGFTAYHTGSALWCAGNITDPKTRRYRGTVRQLHIINGETARSGVGFDLRNASDMLLEQLLLEHFATGVQFYADAGLGCYYNDLVSIVAKDCNDGFWFGQLANENNVMASRTDNTDSGVVVSDGSHNKLDICCENFANYGFNISGPAGNTVISSPRLENVPTKGTGIRIVSTASKTTILSPQYIGLTTNLDNASTSTVKVGTE